MASMGGGVQLSRQNLAYTACAALRSPVHPAIHTTPPTMHPSRSHLHKGEEDEEERTIVVTKGELLALFPEMLKGAAYGLGLGFASVSLYNTLHQPNVLSHHSSSFF
jgi:hypothetical protein